MSAGTTDFTGQLAAYQQAIPDGVAAAQAREAGKKYDQAAFNRLLDFLSSYNDLSKFAYPLMVPPAPDAKSRADWQNIGQNLMSVVHGNDLSPGGERLCSDGHGVQPEPARRLQSGS